MDWLHQMMVYLLLSIPHVFLSSFPCSPDHPLHFFPSLLHPFFYLLYAMLVQQQLIPILSNQFQSAFFNRCFFACLLLLCPRIFISTSILSPFHLQIHVSVPLRRCILLDPYSLNSVPISTFQSGKLGLIVSKNTYICYLSCRK